MRFILNFFFFGILFYLIWMFFPEAFKTLISWADEVVAFFKGLIQSAAEKARKPPSSGPSACMAVVAALLFAPEVISILSSAHAGTNAHPFLIRALC